MRRRRATPGPQGLAARFSDAATTYARADREDKGRRMRGRRIQVQHYPRRPPRPPGAFHNEGFWEARGGSINPGGATKRKRRPCLRFLRSTTAAALTPSILRCVRVAEAGKRFVWELLLERGFAEGRSERRVGL